MASSNVPFRPLGKVGAWPSRLRQLRPLVHGEAHARVLELGVRSLAVPVDGKAERIAVERDHAWQVGHEDADHVYFVGMVVSNSQD